MIGGFEEPTSGLIELQGQNVTRLAPYKLRRCKVSEIKTRVADMRERDPDHPAARNHR